MEIFALMVMLAGVGYEIRWRILDFGRFGCVRYDVGIE